MGELSFQQMKVLNLMLIWAYSPVFILQSFISLVSCHFRECGEKVWNEQLWVIGQHK
jgi:hypothetical protein